MVYYSIEWLPNDSEFNCWNQLGLTRFEWLMKLYKWEANRRYGATSKIRVREL
jgi:hypothetical protein